jgi:glycosyltransferase involved in cell wall biosynthesis
VKKGLYKNMNGEFKYSVLMPVYIKDNPEWLKIALDGMMAQTLPPSEFVIVKDGKITEELNKVLNEYKQKHPVLFKIMGFDENRGVGLASKFGVENCSYDYIARMDADDYCIPERIEKQYEAFGKNEKLGAVGCLVDEFTDSPENVISRVMLPLKHEDIVRFAKKRCPIRHSALLMKKEALVNSGNYSDIRIGEDYDVAVKLIMHGFEICNIPEVYVYMRINPDFFKRRGGIKFLKSIYRLKKNFRKIGFYSRFDFMRSFVPHAAVCLMPNFLRDFIYRKFLRKNYKKD